MTSVAQLCRQSCLYSEKTEGAHRIYSFVLKSRTQAIYGVLQATAVNGRDGVPGTSHVFTENSVCVGCRQLKRKQY